MTQGRPGMTRVRRGLGILLILGAPAVVLIDASARYTATTCADPQLGPCVDSPNAAGWIIGAMLLVAGVLTLAPWWLRWLTSKS